MRLTGARNETGGTAAAGEVDTVDELGAPESPGQRSLSAQEGDTFLPEAERIAHQLEEYITRTGPAPAPAPEPVEEPSPSEELGEVLAALEAAEPDVPDEELTASVPLPEPSVEVVFHKKRERAAPAPPAPAAKPAKAKKRGRRSRRASATESTSPPVATSVPSAAAAPTAVEQGGPKHTGTPLGELLVGRGLVSEDQLTTALTSQTGSGKRLGNILVELGLLSERGLVEVLAEQLQLEIVDVGRMELDRDVVNLLPEEVARALQAVPIARAGDRIDVAVADPLRESLQEELIQTLGLPVRLFFATKTDVDQALNTMYATEADLGDALRMFEAKLEARKSTKETETTVTTVVDENAPVVKVVNLILEQAVRERASDVHIEPMEHLVRVRVRTDGALHQVMTLPGAMGASLISRIKVMSDMNIVERRKPQDGQLAVSVAGRELDVRVSTTPTVFGEKCVLRVLDKTKAVINLPGLGMAAETYEKYSDLIRSPYGMVICAGPTGSGKTTTLYATLSAINNEDINVVTVEDPVEYVFPEINQIQINEASGLTFANGLRAILRQDPDAILVGEIRDVETARIAVQAALTGHFVMSSLHATDATSALHRFMDMGIEPFLIASSLLGVVGQRLVRKICPHCVVEYEPTPDELTFYQRGGGDLEKATFVHGAGCNFCGETGYYDRVGIYEVLRITDEMKELIVANAPHAALKDLAVEQGMRTLREQAVSLVTQDKSTIAEVLRTVYVL